MCFEWLKKLCCPSGCKCGHDHDSQAQAAQKPAEPQAPAQPSGDSGQNQPQQQ